MIERPDLFSGRGYLYVLLLFLTLFLLSLSIEYFSYKKLSSQKNATLTCKVVNQYEKSRGSHSYYILKLDCGDTLVYTSQRLSLGDMTGQKITAEFSLNKLDFLGYLKGFYAKSKILYGEDEDDFKTRLNTLISAQHSNKDAAEIYKALYTASPLKKELRQKLSSLGISHLMAISGFHLGVLSTVLFFFFGLFYKPLQNRYFPYRSAGRDLFAAVAFFLFFYVWFLDFTPSLLRSFTMLAVGYFLYDRGLKVLSMQTLFVSVLLLVALMPKLLLSIGFWLSVSGVFYIFLFLIHLGGMKKLSIFLLLPVFVYLSMLPFSLYIFGIFSLLHPLSIIWTTLFTLFYPLSILMHMAGFGGIFDGWLLKLLSLGESFQTLHVSATLFYIHIGLSFLAVRYRLFFYALAVFSFLFLIYAMQNVA
ncbi:ComEC/Rec2 family competence protein [Sulfurimonas sp. HSL-1716]|uniref:ComEC/Rec2 family competence protein n=1 Tax=Hydrocurvibacter sulfurireducens TaxID=3131937 RepID=UPI0031F82A6F